MAPTQREIDDAATFEQHDTIEVEGTTLIEGLPGHGLVASIAVDQITEQLGLDLYGTLYDETFPQVVTFQEGMARDPVRVYAGTDPAILTLQSDLALPWQAFRPLSTATFSALGEIEEAFFLAGAPAQFEEERGAVTAVATTPDMKAKLQAKDIDLAADPGVIGGVTGALAQACHHESIPAAVLIVKAHPYLPDPGAAQHVIETALEPLVDFDIDTTELEQQAEEIQERMQQIAEQYEQMVEGQGQYKESRMPGMYQ
ncbi:MAG: proteasome assembly chaperone family protein [Halobacteriota archaeon]|uniref:proteasome assembly chaperone family protein n=1 Tax=Halodesulfurarchaeum sp. HSR-GB TaxID=3074077 RepID=UPI0028585C92|nr:PAC2 family protein [Halodesulfurarchaeum sp. HSR-GB]MDR5656722.1 PAC2 family protein [Halodesulfurarchaeum sp. HSR-GB]